MREPSFVSAVLEKTVLVQIHDRKTKRLVLEMGGWRDFRQWRRWCIPYSSVDELIRIFCTFQKSGVPFSSGKGWAPSEVFEFYRERSLLRGKYLKIYWRRPGDFCVEES